MQKIMRKTGSRATCGGSVFKILAAASALLALFVLLNPCLVRAQLATADILGTVTDTTGAVVPDAKVTVLNTGTGIANSMNTDKTGEYLFSKVQIGTFKVTVEATGFKNFSVSNLVTTAGQRVRVNAILQIGSQVETVQVEATAAAVLQTDSSDINATLETNTIDEMPTNGRNYYSLIGFQPGVSSTSGGAGDDSDQRVTMSFTANGQSAHYNNNMIDGMDNNERTLGNVAVEPSLDALQEVQVESSNYSAEYSRTAGGIANLITKSGTNQFHGTAFEFMRNDAFDAYAWALPGQATKTELRQNQFGGSLGGPILKNKAFFFGDYQGWRQVNGSVAQDLVPTQDEYDQIHALSAGTATSVTFSDQFASPSAGPVTVDSTEVDNLGLAYLMQAPAPLASCKGTYGGFTNMCGNTYNWYGAANTIQKANTYDGRIDYHLNDKNTLFGRFSHNMTTTDLPGAYPATTILKGSSKIYAPGYNLNLVGDNNVAFDWVHIFNPTTLFESKASYLRSNQMYYTKSALDWSMQDLGYTCSTEYCYNTPGVEGLPPLGLDPTMSGEYSDTPSESSRYNYSGDGSPLAHIENTFQFTDSLTLNRKSHSIKIGVALIRRQVNSESSSNVILNYAAYYTGNILSDMLEGKSVYATGTVTMIKHRGRMWEPSAYIQDDWRATKSLTLNLGVRYDIYTPMTDRYGNISNFDLNTNLVVSPNLLGANSSSPTGNIATDFKDVSPRFGFAYSVPGNNFVFKNMVLRGGFGMSYFPANTGTVPGMSEYYMMNAPFIWTLSCGVDGYRWGGGTTCDKSYTAGDLAGGGYDVKYGIPRASYNSALATDPTNYSTSLASSIFLMTNFKPGYLEQFNLQLQKQIGNSIVTVGYVGNLGRRMPSLQNINQPLSLADENAGKYPLATSVSATSTGNWMNSTALAEIITGGNSSWQAGEATYERRLSHGLSANVNFTWSRTEAQGLSSSECSLYGCPMDNGSGTAILVNGWKQYNYTGSTSHRASGMLSYNLPFGKSLHGITGAAVKGWTLNGTGSWNTGAWSTVTSSQNQSGIQNNSRIGGNPSGSEYPNRVKGVSVKPAHQSLANWINPAAFSLQTYGMLGNATNPEVQSPRVRSADLGLGKTFSLLEGFQLQFRAEAFNFTNTPSYGGGGGRGGPPGGPGGGGTSSISGYATSSGSPCNVGVQTDTCYATNQGGFGVINSASSSPRIFQFGLKLIY